VSGWCGWRRCDITPRLWRARVRYIHLSRFFYSLFFHTFGSIGISDETVVNYFFNFSILWIINEPKTKEIVQYLANLASLLIIQSPFFTDHMKIPKRSWFILHSPNQLKALRKISTSRRSTICSDISVRRMKMTFGEKREERFFFSSLLRFRPYKRLETQKNTHFGPDSQI